MIGTATLIAAEEPNDPIWLATTPAWEEKAIGATTSGDSKEYVIPHKLFSKLPDRRGDEAFPLCGDGGIQHINLDEKGNCQQYLSV